MLANEYGSGNKTIILIHGGPSLFGYMKSLDELLENQYKIIDYAQRGTFESPANQKVTMASHITDLANLISKHSKKEKVILIGHSWGANLALLATSEHPEKIEKIILLSTAALNQQISDWHSDTLNARYNRATKEKLALIGKELTKELTVENRNSLMQQRLALTSPFYHLNPKTEELIPATKWNFTTFLESINSIWDIIDAGEIPGILKAIKIPVIAFHGDSDPIPCKETFAFLRKNIDDIETHEIEQSGHFPWLEPTSRDDFLKALKLKLEK
ncbi:alpha/beta fold hydrolase [Pelagibaculum spongiae]|uniref:Alpha/beta hydrolase n=1 Tax=Pelagibaculum spongiae TaxID=2080658 RepID=A0A2V1H5A7_9GAMM|nr:alpha/beta hydrolase [Pelagibaculum spongiae]PVZ71602.1 alpha/beta hydrolase [Pelagibaculum spongiae]